MQLLNITMNHAAPFIMLEGISRVCTNKIDALLEHMRYNTVRNPSNQFMDSIDFVVTLVGKGHLSILDHIQLKLELEEENTRSFDILNSHAAISTYNLIHNQAVDYTILQDNSATTFNTVNKFTLTLNLRTLTEIALTESNTQLKEVFNNINIEIMKHRSHLAIYLFKISGNMFETILKTTTINKDHPYIAALTDIHQMITLNCSSYNAYQLLQSSVKQDINFSTYFDQLVSDKAQQKIELTGAMININTIAARMKNIRISTPDISRLTTDTSCLSVELINSDELCVKPISLETVATFVITGPMPILEQILRHDTQLGITKLSGRYTDFKNNLVYTRDSQDKDHLENISNMLLDISDSLEQVSVNNEVDRFIQPLGSVSLMIWSKPIRLLVPFLKDRLDRSAQYENRVIATKMLKEINEYIPRIFEDLWDTYAKSDYPKQEEV